MIFKKISDKMTADKTSPSANENLLHLEATARIALAYIPFAEECLTTWLRGHIYLK